jgi:hypothetical protein
MTNYVAEFRFDEYFKVNLGILLPAVFISACRFFD